MARRRRESEAGAAAGDRKYARTRRRILDATAQLLSEKGYSGTRLSDVAQQAGIQAPAIYYYFASRDDLIEEVMACGLADMREHLVSTLDALRPGTAAIDRILAAAEAHLRHELEISYYTTASIRNHGQIPERLRIRADEAGAQYGAIWRQLLDEAAGAGALRADLDLRITQMLVMGALNWAAEWWDPGRTPLDALVETAQKLIKHALLPERQGDGAPAASG
ncbi:TetR/AcrR family transcriptional regulator [Mycobacterium sp. NBC_00419]|uniref:TetR/AcrR family transcriptional regulator n=1 Tax=Mycobacterium sp. NBC_00419 TaxID=2975989 RepID=UPI002E1B1230